MKNRLLTSNKGILTRPIQIIDNKAYIATNLTVTGEKGNIGNHWLVTDSSFSDRFSEIELENHRAFSEAPFLIEFHGTPRPGSMLSVDAYQRYVVHGDTLPLATRLMESVSSAIDRFVSFDGSFASQRDMSDFLACWVISTYATPVFDTVGYVWPNGERGSGKTQCLKTLMSMAFMGQTVASGSSFASIRDEAALGATIGFDDCENVRRMDGDKRELLLAGNTKGSGFMHKEPGKRDGTWVTRYIDCFAPRAFTSIGLPDDVLASRTLLIPLIRTGDAAKTRRKPTNPKDWAIDPKEMRDGLWLVVARNLQEIERLKEYVNEDSDHSGRDFDIFQATLTIACWLDRSHGTTGLYERMKGVMEAYFKARSTNSLPSLESLVLQAALECLEDKQVASYSFPTRQIVDRVVQICRQRDITDEELTSVDVQQVGMLLSRLGFQKNASHRSERSWKIEKGRVVKAAKIAGVELDHHPVVEGTGELTGWHASPHRISETVPAK